MHLVTLVVSDKGLLTVTITVPSVTLMNDHNGKVAGTLTKLFFLFVIEQQVCLTQHMLRSARCYAAVLLLKMLS